MLTGDPDRRVRFDTFEADLRSGELWKDGVRVKLTEQPFSVLAMLLTRPGDVVTRDELRKALWPADTFVDFDRGLNKAINRLRDALGDSADAPRYIETLPKRGYRFIGPLAVGADIVPPLSSLEQTGQEAIAPVETHGQSAPGAGRPHATAVLNIRSFAGLAAIALVLLAGAWGWWRQSSRSPIDANAPPVLQSQLLPPPAMAFAPDGLALSRDGVRLAFVAESTDGLRSLWIRDLSMTATRPIAGTDGATFPFWSPDGRRIGFFAARKLKIVDVASGAIRDIAAVVRPSGGTWNEDDEIVFAPDVNGPLLRVNANGGTPSEASREPHGQDFLGHRWPTFLPGTRQFLFVELTAARPSDIAPALRIGSLDTLESDLVDWEGARSAAFAFGHILYYRGGALYALPFDTAARRATGPPVRIASADFAEQPAFFPSPFTVSTNGVLVFHSGPSELVWLDADGRETKTTRNLPNWAGPALSPDGRLLAGSCDAAGVGAQAICVLDLERGVSRRITPGPGDRFPVWSRDGREIAYASYPNGIHRVRVDGSGVPPSIQWRGAPTGWLPDGRILLFGTRDAVVRMAIVSPGKKDIEELGPGSEGQLSPKADWLARVDDGLVVEPFPARDRRIAVASAGASQPRWSRDGRRLFFIHSDRKLMAVDFEPATGRAGAPQVIAQTHIRAASFVGHQYDVAPDGRFIINAVAEEPSPLTLMSGWTSRLER
jgi:DNA-binding winged helix-turn-helix (wHTH) protein/dipeptidyl aminopeptidase/acylaminoacyl peptidase